MLALATRRPRNRLMANATAKLTAKPPQNAPTKPNWLHLVRRDLGHCHEHQRGKRQIDRKAVEVVGRGTIEHAEDSRRRIRSGSARRSAMRSSDTACMLRGFRKAMVRQNRSCSVRELLLQLAMQHLAGRVARHLALGDEGIGSRPLVAGQAFLRPFQQIGSPSSVAPSCSTMTA